MQWNRRRLGGVNRTRAKMEEESNAVIWTVFLASFWILEGTEIKMRGARFKLLLWQVLEHMLIWQG